MFPCKEESSRCVDWDGFVHAMKDAGFTARSNGGSAVLFEGNPKLGGKIVFHKPHPIAKIDPITLRSIGKRMAKWFGWSRELFVTV
jgi:HicA toxin of bacterial toxin-antitoxin,